MDLHELLDEILPYAKRYEELNRARIKIEEQLPFSIDEHVTTTQARRLMTDEIRRNLERIAHKAANIVRANSDALYEGGDDEHLRYAREYIKTFDNLSNIDYVVSSTLCRGTSFDTPPEFDSVRHAAEMYTMDVRKHCEEVMLLTLYEYIKRNM